MPYIPEVSPRDRHYYQEIWGFDPVTDFKALPKEYQNEEIYGYEASYPLIRDPDLLAAGITISAMVAVNDDGQSRNVIAFVKGKDLRRIYCIRTVIYQGPAETVLAMEQKDFASKRHSNDRISVALPPWEHFVALKSFVNAIAVVGIAKILKITHTADDESGSTQSFGLNNDMQQQFFKALISLDPKITRGLLRDWLMQLIDSAPKEWILRRKSEFLSFFEDPFLDNRASLLEIIDDILNNSSHEWLKQNKKVLQGLFGDLFIPPNERDIAIKKWAFDPWANRMIPQKKNTWFGGVIGHYFYDSDTKFYYYIKIPLLNDRYAQESQISLCGRVDNLSYGEVGGIFLGFEHLEERRVIICESNESQKLLKINMELITESIGNPPRPPVWSYAAALAIYLRQVAKQGIASLFSLMQKSPRAVNNSPHLGHKEQANLFEILCYFSREQANLLEREFDQNFLRD